jgi:hypothetical protein
MQSLSRHVAVPQAISKNAACSLPQIDYCYKSAIFSIFKSS